MFLSRNLRLIVAPQKMIFLKQIFATEDMLRGQICQFFFLENQISKAQLSDRQLRDKQSIVFIQLYRLVQFLSINIVKEHKKLYYINGIDVSSSSRPQIPVLLIALLFQDIILVSQYFSMPAYVNDDTILRKYP